MMFTWRRVSLWLFLATSFRNGEAFTPSSFVSSLSSSPNSLTQLSMVGVPFVDQWNVDRMGRLTGVVRNHPSIDDGDVITTSSLADPSAASAQKVVETKSGSKYRLGRPKNPPKANGTAVKAAAKPKPFFGGAAKPAAAEKPKPNPFFGGAKKPAAAKPQPSRQVTGNKPSVADQMAFKKEQQQAKREYDLNGDTVGDGRYLLSGRSKRSTSGKSNIWTAYRADGNGLPQGEAVTIKLSANSEALERETANYKRVTSGFRRGMFVNFYEYVKNAGKNQCALVIEKGDQDLKSYFAQRGSGLTGTALRNAAAAAAQCVQAVHASGLVWTDLKAENFVVFENSKGDMTFKGIDLESAMPVKDNPVDYSPEACPPEFAEAFLAGNGPYFVLDYSYDIWSFGMILYELATGKPYFGGKKPSQITRALKVPDYEWPVDDVDDDNLKSLIKQCLQTNPRRRPNIAQILLHPYFLTSGVGPFSF